MVGKGNPFSFEGPLQVSNAATVIILRRARGGGDDVLRISELCGSSEKPNGMVLGTMGSSYEFLSGWKVMMGQNEVNNWMRSRYLRGWSPSAQTS